MRSSDTSKMYPTIIKRVVLSKEDRNRLDQRLRLLEGAKALIQELVKGLLEDQAADQKEAWDELATILGYPDRNQVPVGAMMFYEHRLGEVQLRSCEYPDYAPSAAPEAITPPDTKDHA